MRPARAIGLASSRGFTLLELLAVILLIGLLIGMVAPNLALGSDRETWNEARKLAAAVELARQRAVTSGAPHQLVLDLDEPRYWVEWDERAGMPLPTNLSAEYAALDVLPLSPPAPERSGFERVPGIAGRPARLPHDIHFQSVETGSDTSQLGRVAVRFERDGSAPPARLVLRHLDGDVVLLDIVPTADVVRISRADR